MSYLKKLLIKRDNMNRYMHTHGAINNQMVLEYEITDRIIQRYTQ